MFSLIKYASPAPNSIRKTAMIYHGDCRNVILRVSQLSHILQDIWTLLDSHLATGTTRDYLEGTALHGGLELLYETIFVHNIPPYDPESLVSKMRSRIVSSDIPIDIGEGILSHRHHEDRRRQALSHRDELTDERAPLPFQGDDLSRPPLAWTIMWRGTYSNLIGTFIPKETRRWGYIFWDADRMKRHGGNDLMERPGMKYRGLRDWRDRLDELRELESRR